MRTLPAQHVVTALRARRRARTERTPHRRLPRMGYRHARRHHGAAAIPELLTGLPPSHAQRARGHKPTRPRPRIDPEHPVMLSVHWAESCDGTIADTDRRGSGG